MKQKTADALKASKLTSSKTVLSSGKNILIGILNQMESTLKVTTVQTFESTYTIFNKDIPLWGVPHHVAEKLMTINC